MIPPALRSLGPRRHSARSIPISKGPFSSGESTLRQKRRAHHDPNPHLCRLFYICDARLPPHAFSKPPQSSKVSAYLSAPSFLRCEYSPRRTGGMSLPPTYRPPQPLFVEETPT